MAYVKFGGDTGRALGWACSYLGLDSLDPERIESTRRAARPRQVEAHKDSELVARSNRASAMRARRAPVPDVVGTPVDRYLLGRGIDLRQLRALQRGPGALRYHPELWCAETRSRWPAMLAVAQDFEGAFLGIHRTYLAVRPDGAVVKAPSVKTPKRTLGAYCGGFISLWHGKSGARLADAPAGDRVNVAEGIEDGLTAALVQPDWRAIAEISVSNMANLDFPDVLEAAKIVGQNDPPGSAADRALQAGVAWFHGRGKDVLLWRRPPSVKDINKLIEGDDRAPGQPAGDLAAAS